MQRPRACDSFLCADSHLDATWIFARWQSFAAAESDSEARLGHRNTLVLFMRIRKVTSFRDTVIATHLHVRLHLSLCHMRRRSWGVIRQIDGLFCRRGSCTAWWQGGEAPWWRMILDTGEAGTAYTNTKMTVLTFGIFQLLIGDHRPLVTQK